MRHVTTAFCSSAVRAAIGGAGVAVCAGFFTAGASAQDFYAGKTLTVVVGTDAGGGYDIYARTIARHLGKQMPGKPTVIVQNMPGAGSAKAAEFMYNLAPKDGTTIGLIFPGMVVEPLLQPGKFRFDPTKYEYLGSADSGIRLCVTHKSSKIKSFEDALKMPSTFGGQRRRQFDDRLRADADQPGRRENQGRQRLQVVDRHGSGDGARARSMGSAATIPARSRPRSPSGSILQKRT